MLIEKQYIQELLDLLDRELTVGNTWVAYTHEPYPTRDVHFFKHEAEVKNFCITATVAGDESVTKDAYFIRKTQDLNLAVLKDIEQKQKDGDLSGLHVIGLPVDYSVEAIVVKGIYLPDLKRVIEETQWHEYKDMGLNWANRHSSMWWELNGSYRIDRIDREIITLLEDRRTKNIIEQLIGKDYLPYFDRSLLFSDEQRAKIESQLADYPFAELNDAKQKAEIIESLGKGNAVWMTLKKGFYPEPEIGQYIVFEHLYPEGIVYENGHSVRELGTFSEFSMALEYLQGNALKHLEIPTKRVSELLLIGQYHDKELLFDYEGLPENQCGLHIATGWKNGNNVPELIFNHIPHEPILLKQSFFVSLDDAGILRFNDGVNDREIDLSFWKPGTGNMNANVDIQHEQLRIPFTNDLVEQYFSAINSNLKFKAMNVKNADFLKNQVKMMGHGDQHFAAIEKNMHDGMSSFISEGKHEFYQGNRKLTTELNFKQGNKNEMYFWNSYEATLTSANGLVTKQRFFIDTVRRENEKGEKETRTVGFTPKEACNLIDLDHKGNTRSVYKEFYNRQGEPYMAWYKVDLNTEDKHKNHPVDRYPDFDIKDVIAKHNIKENLDDVVQSIQRGNLQAVTIEEGGIDVRRYFAADAVKKDIFIYDRNLKLVYQNEQEMTVQVVNVIPEKNASQVQETNSGQQVSVAGNNDLDTGNGNVQAASSASSAQDAGEKDKEPLLSNGTTNQSQEVSGQNHSKNEGKSVEDEAPLLGKGTGKKGGKKATDKGEAPPKDGPSKGKGDGDLIAKNRKSDKSKGVQV